MAWGDAALTRAQAEDKPIIVSIGYSTCHWCHVMERESFEDPAVAKVMNENFVCIKVDREERPDVDRIYMEACQAISGSGGWPLNAFLLPDGRPFYAGTYYPPESRYNRPGWTDLLLHFAKLYAEDRAKVEEQAAGLTASIADGSARLLAVEPESEDHEAWRKTIMAKLLRNYDNENGGFGGAPKFPGSQALEALLTSGLIEGNPRYLSTVGHAVGAMLKGGIYDQLGGGFSRYTVDAAWRIPHFEKMLYDNALLLRLLGKLQRTSGGWSGENATAIRETTDWLEREMKLPAGGYRAALDADSEGVEGKYYTWTLEEVEGLLPADQARLITDYYGLTRTGNWEEEHTNIFYRPEGSNRILLTTKNGTKLLAAARKTLHDHRFRTRIHPGADDKLILQWNALLISGWAECYKGTGDERYLTLATDLWQTLTGQLLVGGRWHRNLTNGDLGAPAFLDDYAALATAALDLHDVTFDLKYVLGGDAGAGKGKEAGNSAASLVDFVLEHFSAPEGPMFLLRPTAGSELPVASVDLFDNALPSGNSQLCAALLRLHRLTGEQRYLERGEHMLAAMAGSLERYPSSFGTWLEAALLHALPPRELVITGPGATAAAREIPSRYRPGLLIVATETAREDVPLLRNRYLDETLRFFVCENQTCRLPVSSLTEALAQMTDEEDS